jgi:DNA repair photolyase
MIKTFKGKAIYNPSGKAGEYSYWACNFYNGCSARCTYCYNRTGLTAPVLGADHPTLKKKLINEDKALEIFADELEKNLLPLKEHGLFFSFVSDPFLPETVILNFEAIHYCIMSGVPVKVLTKQTFWITEFLAKYDKFFKQHEKRMFAFGFTLTGHDELEPGASPNAKRIEAMKILHDNGFITWASIEPIIDLDSSYEMIIKALPFCEQYKIGLKSGITCNKDELHKFVSRVLTMACYAYKRKIYFKDSLLKQAHINRITLPINCVTRDYNIFHEKAI